MMYDWVQQSDYTGTIFGPVALFADIKKGAWKFARRQGRDLGPLFSTKELALKYAAAKGWHIEPYKEQAAAT